MSVMGAFHYSYANARIHGMRSNLLSEKQITAAVKFSSLNDFLAFLEDSPYKEALYATESKNPRDIENALLSELIRTNKIVLDFAPKSAKIFLSEYFKRYEIQYLKNLLYSKAGERENFHESYTDSFSRKFSDLSAKLKETKNVEEVVIALERTNYGFLRSHIEDYKTFNSVLPLILSLDTYYFGQLLSASKKMPSRDKDGAENIIGMEIDAANIMTLLRKLNTENIERFLILHSHRIPNNVISMCLKATSVEDVISKLSETTYSKILSDALDEFQKTNSLLSFELALKKYVLAKNKELSLGDPFYIGTLLSYLALKENEIKNLRVICTGIAHNLSKDEINDSILLP